MNDKSDERIDRLFTAARAVAPDTSRVEYGFETRLLARLREERESSLPTWAWRLCPFFAVIALAMMLWSRTSASDMQAELSIFAGAGPHAEEQTLLQSMTGESNP